MKDFCSNIIGLAGLNTLLKLQVMNLVLQMYVGVFVPNLHMSYERCRSGGLRINLDYLAFFTVHLQCTVHRRLLHLTSI